LGSSFRDTHLRCADGFALEGEKGSASTSSRGIRAPRIFRRSGMKVRLRTVVVICLLSLACLAGVQQAKGRRTVQLGWKPSPSIGEVSIEVHKSFDRTNWVVIATVPNSVTNVFIRIGCSECWLVLRARRLGLVGQPTAAIHIPSSCPDELAE